MWRPEGRALQVQKAVSTGFLEQEWSQRLRERQEAIAWVGKREEAEEREGPEQCSLVAGARSLGFILWRKAHGGFQVEKCCDLVYVLERSPCCLLCTDGGRARVEVGRWRGLPSWETWQEMAGDWGSSGMERNMGFLIYFEDRAVKICCYIG